LESVEVEVLVAGFDSVAAGFDSVFVSDFFSPPPSDFDSVFVSGGFDVPPLA
jgi:hypothetical protein